MMWKVNLKDERIGTRGINNYGSKMEVVIYNKVKDIWVKFLEHGNLVHTTWTHFCDGNVANPYDRTCYAVGYLGEGEYKACVLSKHTPQYSSWINMLTRCYSEKEHKRNPRYKDCSVSEEWHNFQTFAKWYDENYYEIDGQKMNLDKDILVKGNKVYSHETCIFVPKRINLLFAKREASRGDFPIGVSWSKHCSLYESHCNDVGIIGRHNTIEEAFQSYKTHKEQLIKQIAEEYKDKIPNKLYEVMVKYEVEITD